jgi:hypothetical protein
MAHDGRSPNVHPQAFFQSDHHAVCRCGQVVGDARLRYCMNDLALTFAVSGIA